MTFPQGQPVLRGYMHLVAAGLAPAGILVLLRAADSPREYVSAAICGAAMLLLFAVSATYHVFCAGPRLRSVMRRLDHSTIFVAIAGISTPFFLLAVEGAWGIALLALVWSLAAVGIAIRQTSWLPDWAVSTPYLVVGWSPVAALPALVGTLSHGTLVVMLLSGLVYSLGAVIYAVRRPDPFPGVFGYHEVFHALVTVATLSMYLVIRQDVLAL